MKTVGTILRSAACLAALTSCGSAGADLLVSPGPNAAAEGSQGQNFPFNARATSDVIS